MSFLLAALLGQFCVMDHGVLKSCSVRTVNCSGSGMSCAITDGKWVITVNDGGVVIPNCSAGAVTTGNGSTLSCISNVATATALAANPADCSAGQYATTIAANGDLTCAQVQFSQLGGSPLAGGSNTQVQYNNSGVLGGISNLVSDGTNPRLNGVTSHPSAPSADQDVIYDWLVTSGMPVRPAHIDNTAALPQPDGLLWQFSLFGTAANWRVTGCLPQGFGNSAWTSVGPVGGVACTNTGASCTVSGPAWASTNLETRSPIILETKTTATSQNVWCGLEITGALQVWRGNASGLGGFFFWSRVFVDAAINDSKSINKMFVGLSGSSSALTAAANPSSFSDTAYFGFDIGETQQLKLCTNDNSGAATCGSALGSNFVVATGSWFDLYIWAPPNASSIYGAAVRLDSAQNSGLLTASSDLPRNTVQLAMHAVLGSGSADAGATAMANGGMLAAWNY